MRIFALVVTASAVLAPGLPALAQEDFFVSGNEAYQQGDYDTALENYSRIVNAGFESAPLYYNIGNTYFKLGELGPSILNFERAARLDPGNEDVQANLDLARSLATDEIIPLPDFLLFRIVSWWVHLLPLSVLGVLTAAAYLATTGALVGATLGAAPKLLGRTAIATGFVTAVLSINLFAIHFGWGSRVEAIVMETEAPVFSAPSEDSSLLVFNVHEGTKVRIDEQTGQWIEIVLEDGTVGWMKAAATEVI